METTSVPTETDAARPAPRPLSRPLPWGGVLVFGAVLLLLGLLGLGLYRRTLTQVQASPAPDFELTTFDGQHIRLSDLRGQVVVINFWASWCVPCRTEAPILERTWRAYKDRGVVLIGVAYLDTEPEALAFIQEFDITYPNGPDLGTRIAAASRVGGIPETFFVDRQGQLQGVFIGPISQDELLRRIEALLAAH